MKLARTPAHGDPSSADSVSTPAETLVRGILREILVRPTAPVETFDRNEPLTNLGCDSIDLIQLAATLKQRLGLDLEAQQGRMPEWSIAELSQHVERGASG